MIALKELRKMLFISFKKLSFLKIFTILHFAHSLIFPLQAIAQEDDRS